MEKQCKICMNAMVGNEEHVIERMLNSCYRYIDYYVIQCNGSDKTREIIEEFFEDKGIPGFTYQHEWDYPGINRDHTLQKALEADHGCDWILRMDADEQLEVDEDFDWTPLNDTSVQSYNMTAKAPGAIYFRTWIWNTQYPWTFRHDKRHECILLHGNENFQRVALPRGFRHVITNDGNTWVNPTKFFTDAMELEHQHITNGTLLNDLYHFWYIGKSYFDTVGRDPKTFPLGEAHNRECARRALFYWTEYMNYRFKYNEVDRVQTIDEWGYYTLYCMGECYRRCEEYENAIECYVRAEEFCPRRNEHIVGLAEVYRNMGDYDMMKIHTERLVDPNRKLPFPDFSFILHSNFYIDSGEYGKLLHKIACDNCP